MSNFLQGFLDNQAKNKSNSQLAQEARNSYAKSGNSRIDDAHKEAARKELINRGYNPRTGKFDR